MANKRNILIIEVFISLIIVTALMLPYLHMYIPDEKNWDLGLFVYEGSLGVTARNLMYILLLKLSYIILFFIWFLTSEHWWKYSILSLIMFKLYQLLGAFNENMPFVDDYSFWNSLPYILPMVVVLVWISNMIDYKSKSLLYAAKISSEDISGFRTYTRKRYRFNLRSIKDLHAYKDKIAVKEYLNNIITKSRQLFVVSDTNNGLKNIRKRKEIYSQVVIFAVLISLPFAFYLYQLAPRDSKVWNLGYVKIHSFAFQNVNTFLWVLSMKLFLFITLNIWFFSCRHWWKYAILVPFSIVSFQILELFKKDITKFDQYEILYALPVLIPLILFMIWLSNKLNYYALIRDLHDRLEKEIDEITSQINSRKLKDSEVFENFSDLFSKRDEYSHQGYLERLHAIKKMLGAK